mgnify:CR=1 FL=1
MDVNKNSYTFIFATVMVVVVAAVLSFAATTLKPLQQENVRMEKMQNILSSIDINKTREESAEVYPTYITQEIVLTDNQLIDGVEAFNVDMAKEVKKAPLERNAPLYIAEKEGEKYFIIPLQGTGLWGPIWGYISLKSDLSIYGAVFDHAKETPGLGAEIKTDVFASQFKGKEILDENGNLIGIDVRKGDANDANEVDVEIMIQDCLQSYIAYLKDFKNSMGSLTPNEIK